MYSLFSINAEGGKRDMEALAISKIWKFIKYIKNNDVRIT